MDKSDFGIGIGLTCGFALNYREEAEAGMITLPLCGSAPDATSDCDTPLI